MSYTEKNLTDSVRDFIKPIEGKEIDINYLRSELNIDPNSPAWDNLRVICFRLAEERLLKPSGKRDGVYKVIKQVEPVKWWNGEHSGEPLDFRFPRSYSDFGEDDSGFGIENCVEVFAGDMILIAGQSNYGKTAMALNILAENLDLFKGAVLMGSEYTATDGKITPKFKRRMNRMNWVEWIRDGIPRFDLLPVGSDFEDYVREDYLNVFDWITLPGEYYLIDNVLKSIKDRIGDGVAVTVIQKNKSAEFGEGGERTQRFADVELKIDSYGELESMLTIGKVKAPKGKATGRTWAFKIVDYGANFHDIREIVKCPKCFGKGYLRSGQNNIRCQTCNGLKYIDK